MPTHTYTHTHEHVDIFFAFFAHRKGQGHYDDDDDVVYVNSVALVFVEIVSCCGHATFEMPVVTQVEMLDV